MRVRVSPSAFNMKLSDYMNRKAFFSEHILSLGDVFSSVGIVRYFAKIYAVLYVVATPRYYQTVKCLYSDEPSIIVLPQDDFLTLRAATPTADNLFFGFSPDYAVDVYGKRNMIGEEICEFFNLPNTLHYDNFRLPSYIPGSDEFFDMITKGHKDYIVVNRYLNANCQKLHFFTEPFNSEEFHVIEMNPFTTDNLLQYVKVFQCAKQIHTVPTSIYCLVDHMKASLSGTLFLHDLRKNFIERTNGWNVVTYPEEFRI